MWKTDIPIPFVHHAALSARYRLRIDPVYQLRGHYRMLYDQHLAYGPPLIRLDAALLQPD